MARKEVVTPTEQDLVDAILAAMSGASSEAGVTTQELRDATGRTERVICRALRRLQQEGRLVVVQVWRTNLAGVESRRPGYRLRGAQ
jgi:hypothetical protein